MARKLPSGRWQARVRDEQGQRVTADRTFTRKTDAERWEREQRVALERGAWVDPRAGRTTVKEWCEQWRTAQPHRAGTAALYERLLRLHVYPVLGDLALSRVTAVEVDAFVLGLESGKLGAATRRQVQAVVRTAFRAAVRARLLNSSPFADTALPDVPRSDVRVLEADQLDALVEAVPGRYRALVVLAWQTGMRQGELLGLTRDRVDRFVREVRVDRQLVYVPGAPPQLGPLKTDRRGNRSGVRTVPLSQLAKRELAEHMRKYPPGADGLVFTRPDGAAILRTSFHGGVWRPALRAAGLPPETHFHHLRHTFASTLLSRGVDAVTVSRLLGHSTPAETLRTYAHLMPDAHERVRVALDAMEPGHVRGTTDDRRASDLGG
jgi:integrase